LVEHLTRGFEVASVPQLVYTPHYLNVLLRHLPPSISPLG
jgi:hypothetical protein